MSSLLGQFYNKIKGSQEDIASESLTYILERSLRARQTINQIIERNTGLISQDLSYKTQYAGADLERPDISGINENGEEILLIEAKFWSALTKNQPNKYLSRLNDNSVLMFLVPSLRSRTIYEELLHKIKEKHSNVETNPKKRTIWLSSSNKHVIIISWNELLNAIKTELLQEKNQILISDIDQVIGFCETIDNHSFQPITDTDLSPSIPKKINSYYEIIDKVVDEILIRYPEASVKGLQKSPRRYGYLRYFSISDLGMAMGLKTDFWAEYADTPFWLLVAEIKENWVNTERFKRICVRIATSLCHKFIESNNEIFFSLKPLRGGTEDVVINDLVSQIERIYKALIDLRIGENNVIIASNVES